jgi:hypothetical protein
MDGGDAARFGYTSKVINFNSNLLYIDGGNSKIGIGTPNPGSYGSNPIAAKLDVAGRVATDDIWLKSLGTSSNVWVGDILKSIRVGPRGCKNILTTSPYCWTDQKTVPATSCSASSPTYEVRFMKCDGNVVNSGPLNVPHLCATISLTDGSFPSDSLACSKTAEGCLPDCNNSTTTTYTPGYDTCDNPNRYDPCCGNSLSPSGRRIYCP